MRTTMMIGAAALAFAISAPAFAGDKEAKPADASDAKPAEASARPSSTQATAPPATDASASEDADKDKAD